MFKSVAYVNKTKALAAFFSAKFSNHEYDYGDESVFVNRYPLTQDGQRIKVYDVSGFGTESIRTYDKSFNVASVVNSRECPWDSESKVSFTLLSSKDDTGKPIKFDYLNSFHFDEFWIRLKRHLKLLNQVSNLHKKRELVNFDTSILSVVCFYRYDRISNTVSRSALLKFKATQNHPEHKIVILNDDDKFLAAIDDMEKTFQHRYYDGIIERPKIERGKFFNRKEQSLIKMVYY